MLCAGLMVTGCYDDSALQGQIGKHDEQLKDHESRLKELETLCNRQNTNIESLQAIVTALQDKDYVTNVAPINEGDKVLGYTITFSKSGAVTIYNGKDGYVPVMGVKQEESDGQWYWTVDGEWLLDSKGDKVRASALDGEDGEPGTPGQSGVTPTLKIVDGYWYVSYDGGKTWEEDTLGQATGGKGDSMFEKVEYDDEHLYITMADGEKLVLPRTSESQDEGEEQEGVSQVGPVKIRLSSVTATTATFTGSIDASDEDLDYIKVMVRYSRPDIFSAVDEKLPFIVATKPDFNEDKTFSITLLNLDLAAEYKYCIIVQQKNDKKYSEVSSFATPPVSVELDVKSNTQTTVQFKGKVDPTTAVDEAEIAVLINTSEIVTKSNYSKKYTLTSEDIKEDGSFDVSMSGLKFGTTYHYTYYVLNNYAYSYGTIQTFKTEGVQVNISVGEITQTAATISGNISLTEKNVLEVGLLYSLSSSDPKATTSGVNKVVLTDIIDADGNFSYKAENLLNESTYYYRYYIKQGSTYTYGEVLTFKTEKVPVTIEVESIDKNVVTFKGNVQFSEAGVIEIGVQYYPKSTTSQSAGIQTKAITEISENGDFTVEISGLLLDTEYYWQYYLLQNGVTIVGLPQIFEIADLYNVQSELNMLSASDLSSSASANCYIISESGLYKFKTVKGNSSESVGCVASASILWETFGTSTVPDYLELIDGVCYKDGYIVFQTADTFKEGNAVIAAKDANGNILWSWHIWLTDQPQGQVYYNNAGTMMDRNLGATSATPGDVGALGLLYQWGRKDPFLGSSSITDLIAAKSTITWPYPVFSSDLSNGTIAYATANPTTFIDGNSSNNDWYYTGSSSTDNTRWTTSESNKSIYDPCPAGWRVPDGGSNGVWSKACGSSSFFDYTYNSTNEGMDFSGKFGSASSIWYPASGFRYTFDGSLDDVGSLGCYWSASPCIHGSFVSYNAYYLIFNENGYLNPSDPSVRERGLSVRCLQVIDEVAEP